MKEQEKWIKMILSEFSKIEDSLLKINDGTEFFLHFDEDSTENTKKFAGEIWENVEKALNLLLKGKILTKKMRGHVL